MGKAARRRRNDTVAQSYTIGQSKNNIPHVFCDVRLSVSDRDMRTYTARSTTVRERKRRGEAE